MKQSDVLLSWLVSLVLGSLTCGLVLGEPIVSFLFFIVAAICSAPYLVLMVLLVKLIKSFSYQQLLHALLALVTTAVLMIFEREFFKHFYIIFPYYIFGFLSQYWFYRHRKDKVASANDDLLDN